MIIILLQVLAAVTASVHPICIIFQPGPHGLPWQTFYNLP